MLGRPTHGGIEIAHNLKFLESFLCAIFEIFIKSSTWKVSLTKNQDKQGIHFKFKLLLSMEDCLESKLRSFCIQGRRDQLGNNLLANKREQKSINRTSQEGGRWGTSKPFIAQVKGIHTHLIPSTLSLSIFPFSTSPFQFYLGTSRQICLGE